MTNFFPIGGKAGARVALLLLMLATGLGLRPQAAWASHIRAGDIQAKPDTVTNNPRRMFFKMILYTDNSSPVDQPEAVIFFGDGTSTCKPGVSRTSKRLVPGNPDTSINTYFFEHTFSTTGSFVVSFIGENRNKGVLNMDASDAKSFYISTRVTIDPSLGLNHSPVLTAPAVDKAGVGQVFLHNPAAYDADKDSLAFRLRSSQWVPAGIDGTVGPPCAGPGNNQPSPQATTNFRFPNDPAIAPNPVTVPYTGVPADPGGNPAIFVQDVRTGQITWNAPVAVGLYNVAMVVEEWRRTPLGRRLIGEVIRDMQIIVSATANRRPTITIPADICVVAGTAVTGTVTATDGYNTSPSEQTPVSLYAYSGILPPATFVQSQTGPPTARGTFTWRTDCSNVAELPYLVVFKAQDTPSPATAANPPLIDEKTWRITVVGPAPQNLQALAVPATCGTVNHVVLSWNQYLCANATRIHIYRKLNSSGFVPGPCDTGIPASAGYTRIASVNATETSFTDNNVDAGGNVLGLTAGQTYCYRIYAEFPLPAGGSSIASQEACAMLPGRGVMLKNVDVVTTSPTAGQIQVNWVQPRTLACPSNGTLSYELSRGEGLAPATFTRVATFTSIEDTTYLDSGLNTQDLQYTYKLELVRTYPAGDSRPPVREAAPTASSVRLSALPTDASARTITVSWTYNVPWDNSLKPAFVYRRVGPGTGPFVRLAAVPTTATGGTYLDNDPALRKGETYTYYVLTEGQYTAVPYLNSLLNRSQQRSLVLNSPPCTPVLALQVTNCDSLASLQEFPGLDQRYTNRLRWSLGGTPAGCDASVASYQVFYRPTPTGAFTLIGTTSQTSFAHTNLDFSGGCYAVRAVAASGIASDTSNVVCQDNCVFFKLPNIFTPTGDGINDTFRPKNNSPIRSIHFQAFNRWGVKVFENTTTSADRVLINWNGGGPVGESNNSNTKVSDGVYYYLAEVEFADFANTKRTYKGWVEIVR